MKPKRSKNMNHPHWLVLSAALVLLAAMAPAQTKPAVRPDIYNPGADVKVPSSPANSNIAAVADAECVEGRAFGDQACGVLDYVGEERVPVVQGPAAKTKSVKTDG